MSKEKQSIDQKNFIKTHLKERIEGLPNPKMTKIFTALDKLETKKYSLLTNKIYDSNLKRGLRKTRANNTTSSFGKDAEEMVNHVKGYNKKFSNNLGIYNQKKQENDHFLRRYKLCKKKENGEKKVPGQLVGPDLVFKDLIRSYKDRGYKTFDFSVKKNLFRPSGLLLEPNMLVRYYEKLGGKKDNAVSFINKINRQVGEKLSSHKDKVRNSVVDNDSPRLRIVASSVGNSVDEKELRNLKKEIEDNSTYINTVKKTLEFLDGKYTYVNQLKKRTSKSKQEMSTIIARTKQKISDKKALLKPNSKGSSRIETRYQKFNKCKTIMKKESNNQSVDEVSIVTSTNNNTNVNSKFIYTGSNSRANSPSGSNFKQETSQYKNREQKTIRPFFKYKQSHQMNPVNGQEKENILNKLIKVKVTKDLQKNIFTNSFRKESSSGFNHSKSQSIGSIMKPKRLTEADVENLYEKTIKQKSVQKMSDLENFELEGEVFNYFNGKDRYFQALRSKHEASSLLNTFSDIKFKTEKQDVYGTYRNIYDKMAEAEIAPQLLQTVRDYDNQISRFQLKLLSRLSNNTK